MAESISEGTLKTWQKKVGDYVEADEEVATIETDKVCLTFIRYSRSGLLRTRYAQTKPVPGLLNIHFWILNQLYTFISWSLY